MKYFLIALQFLTRIPVRIKGEIQPQDYGRAMVWFPLVGLILGILLVLGFKMAILLFPKAVAIILVLIAYALLTGAIHIDGLADTFDGLGAGETNKEKILEIMKDGPIGAMGALAISLDIILRFVLLDSLPLIKIPQALLAMVVLGRWAQVLFALNSTAAKTNSTGGYFSRSLTPAIFILATIIMLLISIFILKPLSLLFILFFILLIVLSAKNYFKRKIGGITGDTIGAANEITEISVLLWMSTAGI